MRRKLLCLILFSMTLYQGSQARGVDAAAQYLRSVGTPASLDQKSCGQVCNDVACDSELSTKSYRCFKECSQHTAVSKIITCANRQFNSFIADLHIQIKDLQQGISVQDNQISVLKNQLNQAEQNSQHQLGQLQIATANNVQLQDQFNELQQKNAAEQQHLVNLNNQNIALEQQIVAANQNNGEQDIVINRLNEDNVANQGEIREIKAALVEANQTRDALMNQLALTEKEVAGSRQERDMLKYKIEDQEENLKNQEQELQKQIEIGAKEKEELQKNMSALEEKLREAGGSNHELNQKLQQATIDLENLAINTEDDARQLQQVQLEIQRLENEKQKLESSLSAKKKNYKIFKELNLSLNNKRQELENKIANEMKEKEKLQISVKALEHQVRETSGGNLELNQKLNQVNTDLEQLGWEIQEHQAQLKESGAQLQKLENENKELMEKNIQLTPKIICGGDQICERETESKITFATHENDVKQLKSTLLLSILANAGALQENGQLKAEIWKLKNKKLESDMSRLEDLKQKFNELVKIHQYYSDSSGIKSHVLNLDDIMGFINKDAKDKKIQENGLLAFQIKMLKERYDLLLQAHNELVVEKQKNRQSNAKGFRKSANDYLDGPSIGRTNSPKIQEKKPKRQNPKQVSQKSSQNDLNPVSEETIGLKGKSSGAHHPNFVEKPNYSHFDRPYSDDQQDPYGRTN